MGQETLNELLPIEHRSLSPQEIRRSTSAQVISQIFNAQITSLEDNKSSEEICNRYFFHPAQRFFHRDVLNSACQHMDREHIYHITDPFGIHLLLFSVSGTTYLFGPFCSSYLTEHGAKSILKKHNINDIDVATLQYYCGSFPLIEESTSIKIVSAFIYCADSNEPGKTIKTITAAELPREERYSVEAYQQNYNDKLKVRYALEQQFIEDIKNGNTHSALNTINRINQDVAPLKRLGPALEVERVGAAITRTTIRHAAVQAGLPILIVDRLSSENTVRVKNAMTTEDIMLARDTMIRNFCKAIQEMRKTQHSALVQSVLYYLNHNYQHPIDLSTLASDLDISESNLIRTFKKELGITPAIHLTKIRMHNAASLLVYGTMSISEISSAVGISDSNYFVKLFKREFGETPTAYRKQRTT